MRFKTPHLGEMKIFPPKGVVIDVYQPLSEKCLATGNK